MTGGSGSGKGNTNHKPYKKNGTYNPPNSQKPITPIVKQASSKASVSGGSHSKGSRQSRASRRSVSTVSSAPVVVRSRQKAKVAKEEAEAVDIEAILNANTVDVGIPPGLELLVGVTKITFGPAIPIQPLEQYKFSRNYSVRDQAGQEIYFGGEYVNTVSEVLCQGFRPFRFDLFDYLGDPVLTCQQSCSCWLCCFNAECAGAKISTNLASGQLIGQVRQNFGCCTPEYEILDEVGSRLMSIIGECGRVCFLCKAKSFHVYADVQRDDDLVSENVAHIGRRYVTFKEELTVEMKTLVISAMFLLELDYYRSCRGLRKIVILIMLIITGVLVYRFSPSFKFSRVGF